MTEPPPGLAEFERHVLAAETPAVVLIDRALVRALLAHVRELERENGRLVAAAAAEGCFW